MSLISKTASPLHHSSLQKNEFLPFFLPTGLSLHYGVSPLHPYGSLTPFSHWVFSTPLITVVLSPSPRRLPPFFPRSRRFPPFSPRSLRFSPFLPTFPRLNAAVEIEGDLPAAFECLIIASSLVHYCIVSSFVPPSNALQTLFLNWNTSQTLFLETNAVNEWIRSLGSALGD